MANDDPAGVRNSDLDDAAKPTQEGDRARSLDDARREAEIRSLVRQSLDDLALATSREKYLANNPDVMASELVATQEVVRYMTWGVAILGFFVWILINSRR